MSMGGSVQERIRDIERYGLISQIDSRFSWATASLGYCTQKSYYRVENPTMPAWMEQIHRELEIDC